MLGIFGAPTMAAAHEVRPAYLEITETAPNRYQMLWRVPVLNGMPLPVVVALPKDARNVGMATAQDLRGSRLERRIIEVANGLAGRRIDLVGLEATITDVLVRFQPLDGGYSTSLVHPSKPRIEIPANPSMMGV